MSQTKLGQSHSAVDAAARLPRRALMCATALLAVGAGVAFSSRQFPGAEALAASGEPVPGFWSWQWATPQGTQIDLQTFRGRPLLINFWATWCAPCVEELPRINGFYQQNAAKGWQVLGIAVDKPAAVQAFLKKMPLDFPLAIAGMQGVQAATRLGNMSGGLPFSVAVASDGQLILRKTGALSEQDLRQLADLK